MPETGLTGQQGRVETAAAKRPQFARAGATWIQSLAWYRLEEAFVPAIYAPFPDISAAVHEAQAVRSGPVTAYGRSTGADIIYVGLGNERSRRAPWEYIFRGASSCGDFPFEFGGQSCA